MSEEVVDNGQANTNPVVDEAAVVETPPAETDKAAEPQPSDQPADYADFSAPEGMELNQEVLGEFVPMAKELGLNQEQAQRLIDMGSKLVSQVNQSAADMFVKTVEGWREQVKADKDLGGKELDANLGIARLSIDRFGSQELQRMVDDGEPFTFDHPEIVRFAYKIGKAIGQDNSFVSGNRAAEKDPAKVMFPNMN